MHFLLRVGSFFIKTAADPSPFEFVNTAFLIRKALELIILRLLSPFSTGFLALCCRGLDFEAALFRGLLGDLAGEILKDY